MKLLKILILFLFVGISGVTYAQSSNELKRQKEAYQREIEQLQKVLNKTTSGKKLTVQQYNAVNAQIRVRQSKIGVINTEIKNIDNQISVNNNAVKSLQSQLGDLKKEYAGMVRFAQRNRNAYDKMMFIFAAKDFNQAYKRIKYLQQFSKYRKKQAGYIENTQKDLTGKIKVLDQTLKEKNDLLKDQEREREKLSIDKDKQAKILNKFNREEKQIKQDLAQRRKQQAQIDRAIRAAISREIAAARKKAEDEAKAAAAKAKAENKPIPAKTATVAETKSKTNSEVLTATPEGARLSEGFETNRGRLPWPVATGTVIESFGLHKVDQASKDNIGVTIITAENSPVRSVFDGVVLSVQQIYGKYYVVIQHGNYFTVYSNLKNLTVSKGSKVSTKQNIGTVVLTGDAPELLFAIMRDGKYLNPEAWISK